MRFVAVICLVLAAAYAAAQEPPKAPAQDPPKPGVDPDLDVEWMDPVDQMGNAGPDVGRELFNRYCASCHGEKGDGNGPLAKFLDPRPRNFTSGRFKCRSTPPDQLPAKMDLMRAIVHGIPIGGMLSYSFLQTEEQVAMMEHVKSLCVKVYMVDGKPVTVNPFEREGHGKPLKSGNIPQKTLRKPTPEGIAKGKELYLKQGCHECHGEKGDGHGKKAPELVDSDDHPIAVRDFTQGIYSGGPDIRHVYLRLSLGIQGTPMPSYAKGPGVAAGMDIEERWNVAEYVMSLNQRKDKLPLPHSEVLLVKKAEKLPADPWAAEWDALAKIPVQHDPSGYGKSKFAVLPLYFQQLKVLPGRPYFVPASARGYHDKKNVALLLEWDDATSNAGSDGKPADVLEVQLAPSRSFTFALHGLEAEPVNLWRWTGKEPGKGVEVDASGAFKEKIQDAAQQGLKVAASWKGGKWRVLFTRTVLGGPGDAPLDVGGSNPILFHLMDGAWGDEKFQRMLTTWHQVALEE